MGDWNSVTDGWVCLCSPLSLLPLSGGGTPFFLYPLIQDFPISALTGRAAFLHKPTSFGLLGLSNTLALKGDFVRGDRVQASGRLVARMGSRMRG